MRKIVLAAMVMMACGRAPDDRSPIAAMVAACTSHGDLTCPKPILYVDSLERSIAYYRDRLGFKFDWTDGKPPDFASVTRGDMQIFMCQKCQGHPGTWLWVFTKDVDWMYRDLVKRGAMIKAKPDDKPWGVREMQVADPDGNVLRIAGPIKK